VLFEPRRSIVQDRRVSESSLQGEEVARGPHAQHPGNGRAFWRAAAVGVGAGLLAGTFGVGGGLLIVPGLVVVLGFEQRLAHGTSLAAMVPIATSGLLALAIAGRVDWAAGTLIALGAMGGAVIGSQILHRLSERVLGLLFAGLLIATAVRLLVEPSLADGRAPLSVGTSIGLVGLGVATGVVSGLLGVGGGIITVPALIVLYGVPAAIAKGTSLYVILPTALMGTWRNHRNENAELGVAATVGLGGVISGFPAGLLAAHMDDTVSNVLFGLLLLVVAAWMLWNQRDR
jgi:uncharacterized membrane protein YfcA